MSGINQGEADPQRIEKDCKACMFSLKNESVREYEKTGPSNEDNLYAGRQIHLQRTKSCRSWTIYNKHLNSALILYTCDPLISNK